MNELAVEERFKSIEEKVEQFLKIEQLTNKENPDGTEFVALDGGFKTLATNFFKTRYWEETADYTLVASRKNSAGTMRGNNLTLTIPDDLAFGLGEYVVVQSYGTGFTISSGANITIKQPQAFQSIENSVYVIRKTATNEFSVYQVGASSGGGGGAVDSVNGQTGAVVLDAGDIGVDDSGFQSFIGTTVQAVIDFADAGFTAARGTELSPGTGLPSINSGDNTAFDLTAAVGQIRADGVFSQINKVAVTAEPITTISAPSTWVYYDVNGTLQQQTTAPTVQEMRQKLFLARFASNGTNLVAFEKFSNPSGQYTNSIRDLYDYIDAAGVPLKKGLVVTGNADLTFDRSAGSTLEIGANNDANAPNTPSFSAATPANLFILTQNTTIASATSIMNTTQYDVGGTATTMTNNRFVGHRVYFFTSGNHTVQLGQAQYSSLDEAEASVGSEAFVVSPTNANGIFLGWWIVKKNASALNDASEAKWVPYSIGGQSAAALTGSLLQSNNLGDLENASTALTNLGMTDDDTMATANATNFPSGESIKAYVDKNISDVSGTSTVTTLKAITTLSEGDFIITKGWYAENDGGGAIYQRVDPTGLTANDMDIIELTNGNYVQLKPLKNEVTPKIFGCRESTVGDIARLQRFFDYCEENTLDGDWRGEWDIDATITIGGSLGMTYRCGKINTNNSAIEDAVSVEGGSVFFKDTFELFGSNSATYSNRSSVNGITTKNATARNHFENVVVEGFKRWGMKFEEEGTGSNIMSSVNYFKALNCGSADGARNHTINITSTSDTGSASSTAQRTVLTTDGVGVSDIKVDDFILIEDRLHIITDITSNDVSVYPWIKSGVVLPYTAKSFFGGGVLVENNDSANIHFKQIDSIGCGVGVSSRGLYGCSLGQVQVQACGVGLNIGSLGSNNLGTDVTKLYNETNVYDLVQSTNVRTNTVINSIAILDFAKIAYPTPIFNGEPYLRSKPSFSINYNNVWYGTGDDTHKAYNLTKDSTTIVMGNDPKHSTASSLKNSKTVELKWSEDVNRLFGYDSAEIYLLGTGTNDEPTGTVTFSLDSDDQTAGITVMSGTTYDLTNFDKATLVKMFFDYDNQDWIVQTVNTTAGNTFEKLIISKVNDTAIQDFIRNDTSIADGDVIGELNFFGKDSQVDEANQKGASIQVVSENAWGAGSKAETAIVFNTRVNEVDAPTERMRVKADGTVLVNGKDITKEENITGTVVTASVASTYAIDWNAGSVFLLTMTANTTFTDSNLPTGAFSKVITIELAGNFTPTFPSYWEARPSNDSYDGSVRNELTINCKVGTASSENVTYSLENLAT